MITYNIKQSVAHIGKHKGEKIYYAAPAPQDKISTKQVEDYITSMTSLSRSDVRSCITALAEVLRNEMFAGHMVDFADLGSFKLVSTGKHMLKKEEVNASTLKVPRIQFFPRKELREKAAQVQRVVYDPEAMKKAKKKD